MSAEAVAPSAGLEPATPSLGGRCSIQMSYEGEGRKSTGFAGQGQQGWLKLSCRVILLSNNDKQELTMPRLRQVPRAEADPLTTTMYNMLFGDRDPVQEPGTETGTPGNWWTVFALVPDCLEHAIKGFQFYRDSARKLDPQLRELGQTRAGYTRGSQFVYSQHCKSCRSVGMAEDKIEAIAHWQVSDLFSALERAVLAYTDALVLEGGRVSDAVFAVLQEHLSDEEILELTYVTALYEMHAVMSRALRLEYDDVDERIVEIAAPAGGNSDVMNMVDDSKDT